MRRLIRQYLCLGVVLWTCVTPTQAWAQQVVAILSSDIGPYIEAFEGFAEACKQPVQRVVLGQDKPRWGRDVRVVVAFGGKAALEAYPETARLIYCMAPSAPPDQMRNRAIRIEMLPNAGFVVERLRTLHPGLQRIGVFWASEAMGDYVGRFASVARAFGIHAQVDRVEGVNALPDRLRGLLDQNIDALWLPPDPLLINAQSFSVLKTFSWSNDVAFYAPTAGLVEKGAVASISSSFRQIGRTAGHVVQQVLADQQVDAVIYPEAVDVTINLTAATNVGLKIPAAVLNEASRVLP